MIYMKVKIGVNFRKEEIVVNNGYRLKIKGGSVNLF